ncbi:MAG: hypothetical protein RMY36_023260 [Nostoc sp. SerVER01]|nr:hypothetical protein [Nostoc sp. SerVER01]
MTLSPLITKLRLSFIWTATLTDLFKTDQPPAPLVFIGNSTLYRQKFTDGLPWLLDTNRHYFWGHYLKDSSGHSLKDNNRPPVLLQNIRADRAWKQLVPFRSTQNLPSVSTPECRLVVEAFYYPFGFALVIHVEYSGSLTAQQAIKTAFKIREDNTFSIQPNNNCNNEAQNIYNQYQGLTLNLDQLAQRCLNTTRKVNLGLADFPENGILSFKPFTIFTPLQGDGINPGQSIQNSDIHRMLEAVTTWMEPSPGRLPNLSQVSFQFPVNYPFQEGSLIYHRSRGRAVWFPIPLTARSKRRTLSCYHRNLFLTSLQVESLSNLMILAADDYRNNESLTPATYEFCARRAAGILGQLYGRAQTTYNSPSAKIQIDENNWNDSINAVRLYLNVGRELTST